ncbi:MAG TPA: Rrf2 family transcriptional regulator [Planctomycetota bacterium]|nr:Rrf2 family transcriptional regulator [Planctomycetota bacterium]
MVRLTRAGEYAVRGMVYLARRPTDGPTFIGDIARAQQVSVSFLAKIFQGLAKAGLVESQRGAAGGVSLGRPAGQISLRDIVEAVEGPVSLNQCLMPEDPCENAAKCPLAPVWREAQERLLAVLEAATLDRYDGRSSTDVEVAD